MSKPDVAHRITNCHTCNVPLRSDNASGYCRDHKHLQRSKCMMCGADCRRKSKHCNDCAILRRRRPAAYCQMAGCEKQLSENTVTGYCREHSFQAKKCAYDGCTKHMASWNVTDYCTEHYRYGRKLNDPRPKNPWLWPTAKVKILKADKIILQNIAGCPPMERRELEVASIPFSYRAREAIKAMGCITLGDLERVDIEQMAQMEEVGRNTMIEIVSRMKAVHLTPKIERKRVKWSRKRRRDWNRKQAAKTGGQADAK